MSTSAAKKYFWMKLKDSFFSDPKIKKLRKIAGGDTHTIILQKIMLLSLKDGGVIQFEAIEKTLQEELALKLDEDVLNVQMALSYMVSAGLIEALTETEYLLPQMPWLIGSEGDSAERMRRLREKKHAQIQLSSLCDGNVTESDTEKELESDLEIEKGDRARKVYLKFRMAGEGINTPIAFEKKVKKELNDCSSEEFKSFLIWQELLNTWPKVLNDLYDDFCNFGHKNRKTCKGIAADHVKDYGIELTPILFELAFYESCKTLQNKVVS